jgi:hypothetical protein
VVAKGAEDVEEREDQGREGRKRRGLRGFLNQRIKKERKMGEAKRSEKHPKTKGGPFQKKGWRRPKCLTMLIKRRLST